MENNCPHPDYEANVAVKRYSDQDYATVAHLTIWCRTCKKPMQFLGLPIGLSMGVPMASEDITEARLPFIPQEVCNG
jgi:hypothetical protein